MKGDPATRREFEALEERVRKFEDRLCWFDEVSAALDTGAAKILKSPDGPTGPTGPGTPLPDDVPWHNGSPVGPEVIKGPIGSVGRLPLPGELDPSRLTDSPDPYKSGDAGGSTAAAAPTVLEDAGDSTAAAAAPTVLGDATV